LNAQTLPQITPPSPKASSILKYGEYPVSLYTGLVDITIPVYTINIKGIKVPVEFKYHASGIKYDSKSLEVGLGWTLIAGGVITYTPKGNLDPRYSNSGSYIPFRKEVSEIDPSNYCSNYAPSGNPSDDYILRKISEGERPSETYDGESDIYNYSFLQFSGKFFHHYYNNPPNRQTVFVPSNSLYYINESGGIQLADKEGVRYFFTELERGTYPDHYYSHYLTKIISADNCDTVYFNYTEFSPANNYAVNRPAIRSSYVVRDISTYHNDVYPQYWSYDRQLEHGGLMDVKAYYPPRLENITFSGGRVVFEYNSVRDLQSVKVYNNLQTGPLKTVSLEKSLFTNGEQKLDRVVFTDTGSDSYDYRFEYNGNPPSNPSGIDYWGYYNGVYTGTGQSFVPYLNVSTDHGLYLLPGINRSPSELEMKKGILNKITYPTKGYAIFNYEAHRADNQIYGGLRIKEIYNYNSDGSLAEKKWYQYEWPRVILPVPGTPTLGHDYTSKYRSLVYEMDYQGDMFISNITDLSIYSAFPKKAMFAQGSPVVYSMVTEYTGNNSTDYGKTTYTFSSYPDEAVDVSDFAGHIEAVDMPLRTYPWKNGHLLSKDVYKKNPNGQYQSIHSEVNDYVELNTAEYRNLGVHQYIHASEAVLQCWFDYPEIASYIGDSPSDYFNYYHTTGQYALSSSTITEDGVEKTVYYDEYNNDGLPKTIRTVLSNGNSRTVQNKYPSDYATGYYTGMVDKNILSPVVEESVLENNLFLSKKLTPYKLWHSKFYAPENEQVQISGSNLETRLTYEYDGEGMVRQVEKDNADKEVYLWGYNHQYPIAKIENATYADVTGIISETILNVISAKNEPATSDWNTVNGLRTSLPNALITTYKYKPLSGMTEKIDPRGIVTTYEYDDFQRLKTVKDHNNSTVEEYEYHYKNQ
jgi:YD repeat-containing protein